MMNKEMFEKIFLSFFDESKELCLTDAWRVLYWPDDADISSIDKEFIMAASEVLDEN